MQLIKIAHIWRALLMCQLVEAVCPIKSTGNHQHYGNVCVCVCGNVEMCVCVCVLVIVG